MTINRSLLTIAAALLATASLSGCGAGDCNELSGVAEKSYDLIFDRVVINRQENKAGDFQAMTIEYIRGSPGEQQIPVKVIAKAPLESGKTKDISGDGGGITRAMSDASAFKDLTTGVITFDPLGDAGESTEGDFFVTFEDGRTLNGEFCGTVELLTL